MVEQRTRHLEQVLSSTAQRKVIVAGPGTGKSFTFKQILGRVNGNVLVLTFLGNLVTDLERDLGDQAQVRTFHSYSRGLLHNMDVAGISRRFDYFPGFSTIIDSDIHLIREDVPERAVEPALMNLDDSAGFASSAMMIGNYYDAVGHTDAVYRVYQALTAAPELVPHVAQLLVDEYQDFSLLEASLIGQLAEVSPTLIVGDDDQALYSFKHASADYLRQVVNDGEYDRFELPFCTRCTQVLVAATHGVVARAQADGLLVGRINKQYICFLPEKRATSEKYPRIVHARCSVERNSAPYMCRFIAQQIANVDLHDVESSHKAGHPAVLVVAPPQFARRVHQFLAEDGVPNLELGIRPRIDLEILDGYKRLLNQERSRLGWRLVLQAVRPPNWESAVRQALLDDVDLFDLLPEDFRTLHLQIVALLRHLLEGDEQTPDELTRLEAAAGLPLAALRQRLGHGEPEPTPHLDVTAPRVVVTTLLGAKGLQAEHVYVVGLNEHHFPRNNAAPTEDEVCQLLVALTRARQSCTLLSCGRFGNQSLARSVFLQWLSPMIESVTVNAAYWNN